MNTTQSEVPLERDDRNEIAARRETLEDKLEKYQSFEELEKLFLEAKRHHPTAPLPAQCKFRVMQLTTQNIVVGHNRPSFAFMLKRAT